MSRSELTNLQVSVSILCHFEDGADWSDWKLGTHGIRIEWISERGNRKTATFLPEVPLAQGWDKTQTIDSLLRKGGFKGTVTPEVRRSIRLVRYQSEMLTITYQEYLQHCRYSGPGDRTELTSPLAGPDLKENTDLSLLHPCPLTSLQRPAPPVSAQCGTLSPLSLSSSPVLYVRTISDISVWLVWRPI